MTVDSFTQEVGVWHSGGIAEKSLRATRLFCFLPAKA
jgi:hypothetical protein